ncbi:DUF1501 domain-containing protein [Tautonia marina]|uniref:DUF1501 domain-containing protein n=1 Tax=Tautonia marina TaxID=2653855 RepID=UPI0012604759|nr:DUF1501 domain-containing protein [Tautonia marina]
MLSISGPGGRYCDGVSRRGFLKLGSLAFGGLSLPQILRAEQTSGVKSSEKAIIMIVLPGGPPHLDMFDLKPEAPAEIRGEFSPIATSVPGIAITELMPRLAASMDRFAVIRTLVGGRDDHNLHQCLTGWESHPQQGDSREIPGYPDGGWPSIGAVLSAIRGPSDPAVPPFLSLAPPNTESTTRASLNQGGYLGARHAGFEPFKKAGDEINLSGVDLNRLADRRALLGSLDRFRSDLDQARAVASFDAYTTQAFDLLTSSTVAEALDLSREDPRTLARYGVPLGGEPEHGGPKLLENLVVARRLVEAGVRCVTLAFSPWPLERESRGGFNWDWHFDNFTKARVALPMLDQGITALVEDLEARGRLEDVSIVVWGEFGRTPRINKDAGRDHWPHVGNCLLAGGGLRTGQVIGRTDRFGERPVERPVHFREVFATLYHSLGIHASDTFLRDRSGRPIALVDDREPIRELI